MKKINLILIFALAAISLFYSCKPEEIIIVDNITSDVTWTSEETYVINGNISVENGAILTILPGTKVYFSDGYGLYVYNGTLIADGTEEEPILFTSDAAVPTKGSWNGLVFYEGTLANTSLKYCTIEFAGKNETDGAVLIENCEIAMNFCTIKDSQFSGIVITGTDAGFVSFADNTIKQVGKHAIELLANAIPTIGTNNVFTLDAGFGIEVNGGSFSNGAENWNNFDVPYYVTYGVNIDNGATCTIEPGTTIKFAAGTWLSTGYASNGTLKAEGTLSEPITFTSSSASPTGGAWTGLLFYGNSTSSSLKYCTIEYGGDENYMGNIYFESCLITVENCIIRNSGDYGVICYNSDAGFTSFINNTLTDNENHAIKINAHYVHTIGAGNVFTCPDYKGIQIDGGDYNLNGKTWLKHNVPYYVTYSVYIKGSITFEAGCVFKASAGVWFEFGYGDNTTFTCVGTSEEPIIFTSSAASPDAGSWGGIYFYESTTSTSEMEYVNISYGGQEAYATIILNYDVAVNINNISIDHSEACAIYTYGGASVTGNSGNVYTNNGTDDICVP